ncbi:MAG: thioredoxin domain-containing protein [Acetobacteraceae bacterium]
MRLLRFLGALVVAGLLGFGAARAATIAPYSQAAFTTAQHEGKPILVYVTAPWCPTCAQQRPILSGLYDTPEFKDLQVFTVDFDTSKPLLHSLNVQMQSTLIAYHGSKEEARATGITTPDAIHALLAKTKA